MTRLSWSKVRTRVEDRGRRLARSVGRWAGETLPVWGQRLDDFSARVAGAVATTESVPDDGAADGFELEFTLDEEPRIADSAAEPGGLPNSGVLPDLGIPADRSLTERLEIFAESVRGATGSYAAFVADAQGLPLVSRHGTDDQIAITAALDRALEPIRESLRGTPQGSVAVEIDRHNVLQVIWVNTDSGRYVVGLVLPQSLGGDFVESIRAQVSLLLVESRESAA